jgi:tetratricopeptide (TPR) repeat protein
VARGTQHRKRRQGPNARPAAVATTAAAPRHKQRPPQWQEQLFFQRLRVHAKGVFFLLAVVFALSFVFLGVGSGSTGISDALQNFFTGKGSSGTSTSGLLKKTEKNPLNAAAWRDLATAYEAKQDTAGAITALSQYVGLKSKDTGALAELGNEYTTQAQQYATAYQNDQTQIELETPASQAFAPASTTPLGKAFSDPNALKDPIASAVQTITQTQESTDLTSYQSATSEAEQTYEKLVKVTPNDPNAQIQLGQAAEAAQDTKVAIAAYTKFLKLAPTDPLASQVKSELKTLNASAAATSTSKSASK